ncbi:MAG: ATP-binding cassette domain-containing protein [Mycoplasmoidaceae bacterium]|nr:MAG: ATP-binding cassette domain-containing protein [Mycoplasmoidaceae bacterium]
MKQTERKYIEFKNIGKTYSDRFTAVSGFNLGIDKGEFVTLLGPSGCGKTTILKMLGGFENVTEGTISVNGLIINDLPANKRVTSTVFQDYALFPNLTVYKNIKFGLKSMRVDLPKGDVKDDVKKLTKLKSIWSKQVEKKLKEIEKQSQTYKAKLAIDLEKYNKNTSWMPIKDMRRSNYEMKVLKLEAFKRALLKDDSVFLDKKLHSNSTKYDKEFHRLSKAFKSKCSLDKTVDSLKSKLNYLVDWQSYWSNYVDLQTEKYERHHTTRALNRKEIAERVKEVIEKVGLTGKENKYPSDLSGGMQQRVALARSIVIEPEIILLDEPLSALDAKVRHQMQVELKRLHEELGLTFILVTHDQEEALSLSTKVVVMSNGKIQQIGDPRQVYDFPSNKWVSQFIGKANIFTAKRVDDKFKFGKTSMKCDNPLVAKSNDKEALFVVRPEDMVIVSPNSGYIKGKIKQSIYKGLKYDIECSWDGTTIQVESTTEYPIGKEVGLKWNLNDIHFIQDSKEDL